MNMVKRCNNSENRRRKRSLPEDKKTSFIEEEKGCFSPARTIRYSPEQTNGNPGHIVCRPDGTYDEQEEMTGRPEYTKGSPVSRHTAGIPGCIDTNGNAGKIVGRPECTNVDAGKKVGRQDWNNGSLELVSSGKEWTSGYQELVNISQEWTSDYQELVNSSQEWTSGSPAMKSSSPSWKSPVKTPNYSPDASNENKETENDRSSEKELHLRQKRRGTGQTFLLSVVDTIAVYSFDWRRC